ncbi:universal stress protein [Streptomyces durhamensis]
MGHKPVGSAAVRIAVEEAVLRGGPQEAVPAWRRPLHHRLQTRRRRSRATPAVFREADLLVVGARRRPRHSGLQRGRVARGVLHPEDCPVAVVPEPAWEPYGR